MKSTKDPKVISSKKNNRSFIFMLREDIIPSNEQPNILNLVKLRHPKTGDGVYFAVNAKIHEILKFSEDKRSYFIDDNVASDGNLYLSTPIDPLFLLLPYLIKAQHCCPLDQLLMDDQYPDIVKLLCCFNNSQLHHIADKKGDDNLNAFIYNEDKTLIWLKKKIDRVAAIIKTKGIHVSSNKAISANFVKSEICEDSQESYSRFALGLIGEYLPPDIVTRLAAFIGLPSEEDKSTVNDENESPKVTKKKRDKSNEKINENKKLKLDESFDDSVSNSPTVKVDKKQSAKEQAMAKAAKGTKSISSFFKKK